MLEALQGKVTLGLASMNTGLGIHHLLRDLDVAKFFDVVVTGDEVSKSKPNPEIFLKTAQKLGAQPAACVVVEDSIFGVQAAKAGQMGCVAVTQGAYSAKELQKAKPDLIVASLMEKTAILEYILT